MCELTVYAVKGADRNKVMEGVVRLFFRDDKVLAEDILGDSIEIVNKQWSLYDSQRGEYHSLVKPAIFDKFPSP